MSRSCGGAGLQEVAVQGCRIGMGTAGEAWRLATRSSGRAAGVRGCCSIVLFCPKCSRVTAGVTNCSKRECYIKIGTTPRLGFGSLMLHKYGCTVDRDTEMVSEGSPEA